MGTSQEQKARSREAIVQAAAKLFRQHGIEEVSVAQIMDAAGMTHGGFPRHFASKQELVKEALAAAAGEQPVDLATPEGFKAFADAYLTRLHRDHPESGCVFAALGGEVSRAPAGTRHVLGERIAQQAAAAGEDSDAQAAALGRWSTLIGAMVLARLVEQEDLSDQILAAARKSVGLPD